MSALFVIRSSKGDYWTGKRVEGNNRFNGMMGWTQDPGQAAQFSQLEVDEALAHPKAPPGLVVEPVSP